MRVSNILKLQDFRKPRTPGLQGEMNATFMKVAGHLLAEYERTGEPLLLQQVHKIIGMVMSDYLMSARQPHRNV